MTPEFESCASHPVRVLLLESGSGPRGAVNFIRDLLLHVDHSTAHIIVGFYSHNPSKTVEEIQRLGYPVVFFNRKQSVAQKNSARFSALFDRSLKRLPKVRTAAKIVSRLCRVQLPLTWRLWRFIKRESIDVVVLHQDVHSHVPG